MPREFSRIGVIGAGSWGTALANHLARKGKEVHLWVREPHVLEQIQKDRENKEFLPGVSLSHSIIAHGSLEEVAINKELLVIAVPSHVFRPLLSNILEDLPPYTHLLVATKGIENESLMLMSQITESISGPAIISRYACLAGPSFAKEVARDLPTAVTIASQNLELAKALQSLFSWNWFRVYVSQDLLGAQLAGALKNVIAIAAGLCDALGFGHNARAALVTRGLVEITRLGLKMGAEARTFAGLAGLGDLLLTCTSELSRNRTFGFKIGMGIPIEEVLASTPMVAEGYKTAKSAYYLSLNYGCEMPITEQVYGILYEGKLPLEAAKEVMTRSLKEE